MRGGFLPFFLSTPEGDAIVVTLQNLVEYVNGSITGAWPIPTTITFYRIFEFNYSAVNDWLAESLEWCNEQISAGVQAAQTALYDRLVKVVGALLIVENCQRESIGVAFDYSTLGHSVNLGSAHQALTQGREAYERKRTYLLQQLQQEIMVIPQDDWSTDYKDIVGDNLRRTAGWR